MSEVEMTPEETRWFKRLRRVIRDIPVTVEIQVHQNRIQMNRNGARSEAFAMVGDSDNVECLDEFNTERVFPCSESI